MCESRSAGRSNNVKLAAITIAANAEVGRLRVSPLAATNITMIPAAPMTPVSWLFAPVVCATAVRDELALKGKPWKRPAATFAVPRAISS